MRLHTPQALDRSKRYRSKVLGVVPHMHPGTIKPIFVITVMILLVPGAFYSLIHLVDFRERIPTGKRWPWHS